MHGNDDREELRRDDPRWIVLDEAFRCERIVLAVVGASGGTTMIRNRRYNLASATVTAMTPALRLLLNLDESNSQIERAHV